VRVAGFVVTVVVFGLAAAPAFGHPDGATEQGAMTDLISAVIVGLVAVVAWGVSRVRPPH
jgi:hypothetical protein